MTPAAGAGAWRNREVRGLLAAQVASEVGDQFARVAVTLLVLERAGSTFLAALVLAISFVPSVVGGVLLGALADRLPRRGLMAVCDLLRAALVLALALGVAGAPLWVPFAVLLVVEFVSVPFDAARSALFADVAPEPQRLQAAVGASRTLSQVNTLVGLALAGAVVAALSVGSALVVDAATYAASALILLVLLRRRPRPGAHGGGGFLADLREGAAAVLRHPARRALIGLGWLMGGVAVAPEAVALTYAVQHAQPGLGGLLLAAVPAGGAAGAAVAASLDPRRAVKLLLPLAAASCVPLILTGLDPGVIGVLVLWFLAGACQGVFLPSLMVLVALATPAHLRGRVAALAGAGFGLFSAAGLAAVGALADATSGTLAVALAGAAGLLATAVAAAVWPRQAVAAALPAVAPVDRTSPPRAVADT